MVALGCVSGSPTSDWCSLCGTWKSDSVRTLREVEASTVVAPEQRARFRDNYFGRLILEIRPTVGRSYFDDEAPEGVAWEPHTIVRRDDDSFVVTSMVSGHEVSRAVHLKDADCFMVVLPEFGFGEWFCRVRSQ